MAMFPPFLPVQRPASFASANTGEFSIDPEPKPKQKQKTMEKIADFLADGIRANEEIDAFDEAKKLQPTAHGSSPSSFSRRMGKRNQTERSFIDERAREREVTPPTNAEHVFYHDALKEIHLDNLPSFKVRRNHEPERLAAIAELPGDHVETRPRRHSGALSVATGPQSGSQQWMDGSVTAPTRCGHYAGLRQPGMGMQRSESMPLVMAQAAQQGYGRRDSLPPHRLRDISDPTNYHSQGTEATQLKELRNVTAETRKHISQAEAARKRLKKEIDRRQKTSRFIEHGMSPGNRRIDDHSQAVSVVHSPLPGGGAPLSSRYLTVPPRVKAPRSPVKRLSPRKTFHFRPGTHAVNVDRTRFSLVRPSTSTNSTYSVDSSLTPSIPPRSTSRNFSGSTRNFSVLYPDTPPVPAQPTANLDTLPLKVANKIYRHLLVANHEVLICSCGLCAWSASKQPALTRTNRKLRREALPIFYGENRFIIHGSSALTSAITSVGTTPNQPPQFFDWRSASPAWLRTLTMNSRNMIRHVEVASNDLFSVVCMMSTLGFKLKHRLPEERHEELMQGIAREGILMTFTAAFPDPTPEEVEDEAAAARDGEAGGLKRVEGSRRLRGRAAEASKRISVSSLDMWDEDGAAYPIVDDTAEQGQGQEVVGRISEESTPESVATAILDPHRYTDEMLERGHRARVTRGRVPARYQVKQSQSERTSQEEGRDASLEGMFQGRLNRGRVVALPDSRQSWLLQGTDFRSSAGSAPADTGNVQEKDQLVNQLSNFMAREDNRYPGQRAVMRRPRSTSGANSVRASKSRAYSVGDDLIRAATPVGGPPEAEEAERVEEAREIRYALRRMESRMSKEPEDWEAWAMGRE